VIAPGANVVDSPRLQRGGVHGVQRVLAIQETLEPEAALGVRTGLDLA
jgi:hypothetical protein